MNSALSDGRPEPLDPVRTLAQTVFFGQLDVDRLARVAALTKLLEYPEAAPVYRIGEPAKLVYVVVQGMVRYGIGFGGRNADVGDILRRGSVFGWAALTPACHVRIATAYCLSPCRFLTIDGAALLDVMESDHTLGYRLTTQLNRLITGTLTAFAGG